MSAMFAALITVGAYIRIPTPLAPITLQTLFVMLSGLVLGFKYGTVSVIIYVCLGLCGLPVFAGGGGVSYLLNPTFGYIIGFVVSCGFVGYLTDKFGRDNYYRSFLYSLAGLIPIYLIGVSYFIAISHLVLESAIDFTSVLLGGAVVFLPVDLIMCFVAALTAIKIKKAIRF